MSRLINDVVLTRINKMLYSIASEWTAQAAGTTMVMGTIQAARAATDIGTAQSMRTATAMSIAHAINGVVALSYLYF